MFLTLFAVLGPLVHLLTFLSYFAYHDWLSGKVSNRVLVLAISSGLLIAITLFSTETLDLTVLSAKILPQFALGLFLGIACWYLRFWSAGDAKVMIYVSLMLSFWHFPTQIKLWTPWPVMDFYLLLLFFAFWGIFFDFVFFIFRSAESRTLFIQRIGQELFLSYKGSSWGTFTQLFVYFLAFSLVQGWLSAQFPKAIWLIRILFLLSFPQLVKLARLNGQVLSKLHFLVLLGYVGYQLTLHAWYAVLGDLSFKAGILLLMLFFFTLLPELMEEVKERIILQVGELKPGTVLCESALPKDLGSYLGKLYPDGLLHEQVQTVTEWAKNTAVTEVIGVKTMRFSILHLLALIGLLIAWSLAPHIR